MSYVKSWNCIASTLLVLNTEESTCFTAMSNKLYNISGDTYTHDVDDEDQKWAMVRQKWNFGDYSREIQMVNNYY